MCYLCPFPTSFFNRKVEKKTKQNDENGEVGVLML